jgi:putative membrane protein
MRIIRREITFLQALHRSAQWFLLCATCLLLGGCYDEMDRYTVVTKPTSGSAENGAALIAQYGCGACHIVPGIAGANGLVGPPLTHMGRRVYIAGLLRNSPENMIAWLENPQAIVAGNVMPRMGLNRNQAQDIAAYLDTLH